MKKSIFILICSIALFTATSRISSAQDTERKFGIGFNVSYLNYLDGWSDNAITIEGDDDIDFGANITYNFTKKYSIELSFEYIFTDLYYYFKSFSPGIPQSSKAGEFKQVPILLTGRIQLYSNDRANLYLEAGLGYFFHTFDPVRPIATGMDARLNLPTPNPPEKDFDVDNSIGCHIGGSVEWFLSDKISFNIDLKHIWNRADIGGSLLFYLTPDSPFAEMGTTIIDEEIDFDAFTMGAGFKYYF